MPLARRKSSRKSGDRRNELTMQERYLDVKDFWLKQSEARQKELLHVPIRALLQGLCRFSTCPYFIRMTMCIRNIRNLLCDAPDAHGTCLTLLRVSITGCNIHYGMCSVLHQAGLGLYPWV